MYLQPVTVMKLTSPPSERAPSHYRDTCAHAPRWRGSCFCSVVKRYTLRQTKKGDWQLPLNAEPCGFDSRPSNHVQIVYSHERAGVAPCNPRKDCESHRLNSSFCRENEIRGSLISFLLLVRLQPLHPTITLKWANGGVEHVAQRPVADARPRLPRFLWRFGSSDPAAVWSVPNIMLPFVAARGDLPSRRQFRQRWTWPGRLFTPLFCPPIGLAIQRRTRRRNMRCALRRAGGNLYVTPERLAARTVAGEPRVSADATRKRSGVAPSYDSGNVIT